MYGGASGRPEATHKRSMASQESRNYSQCEKFAKFADRLLSSGFSAFLWELSEVSHNFPH